MADKPSSPQKVRFTLLEMGAPLDPSPEELASRRVDIVFKQPFTMLDPVGPNNPSPAVPPAVQTLLAPLADAIGALDPGTRAAAVDYVVTELTKRLAG